MLVNYYEENYYAVTVKMGHVKKRYYLPMTLAISASTGEEAAAIARRTPRVKHDHSDAIIDVKQITYDEYLVLKDKNNNDPFLHCSSRQEQNIKCPNLQDYLIEDKHNSHSDYNDYMNHCKELRYGRVNYKRRKQKLKNTYYKNDFE